MSDDDAEEFFDAWRKTIDWDKLGEVLWDGQLAPGLFGGGKAGNQAVAGLAVQLDTFGAAVNLLKFESMLPVTRKAQFEARDSDYCTWPSLLALMDALEALYRVRYPLWAGYKRYPEVQLRWRCSVSSTELERDPRFGQVRAAIRVARDKHVSLDAAATSLAQEGVGADIRRWSKKDEGRLTWATVLRRCSVDDNNSSRFDEIQTRRREHLLQQFEAVPSGSISVVTDGVDLKVSGSVIVSKMPWLGKNSPEEVRLLAQGLIGIAAALEVDLEQELFRRVNHKNSLSNDLAGRYTVLDTEYLWTFIKAKQRWRKPIGPRPFLVLPTMCLQRLRWLGSLDGQRTVRCQ